VTEKSGDQKVFVNVSMSLDGYMVPEGMDMEHIDDPGYKDWQNKWMSLQAWIFPLKFFRENLDLGEGGETGTDNDLAKATFKRTGVSIMGKRMFDLGEQMWPEEAPFHTPVFVVTHEKREPWERPGGTTFYFVNDGIDNALMRAREVADGRDIRVSGGADTIVQYLNAGLVEELEIALAPVLLGGGTSLIREIDADRVKVGIKEAIHSPRATHLKYEVHTE
jgi:dihydrofolate reductase